jgi:hypothetical protein
MNSPTIADTFIEPISEANLDDVSQLYFRRCNFLNFRNTDIVKEYFRRHLQSRNHLHDYLIKKDGNVVGSSYVVKANGVKLARDLYHAE